MEENLDLDKISFPSAISVTGQDIDLSTLTPTQKQAQFDVFKEIIGLYTMAQPRVIVGLAGPTGSGKSVTAALCEEFARHANLPFAFYTLGIDAFHYPNNYLASHLDEAGRPLKEAKGRFDTYNVPALISLLKDFRAGKEVLLPSYSRITHEPTEGAAHIVESRALLLVEGLWLLFEMAGWEEVRPLLEYCFFIDAEREDVRDFVIRRHERGGRSNANAAHYYDSIDASNFDLVIETKIRADKSIPSFSKRG